MESETECKQLVETAISADSPAQEETRHKQHKGNIDAPRWGSLVDHVQSLRVFLNLMTPRSDSPNVSPIEGVNITKRETLQKSIGITTQDDANCGEMNMRRNATTLLRSTGSC